MIKHKQHGYNLVEVTLLVLITGLIAYTGWYVWNSRSKTSASLDSSSSLNQSPDSSVAAGGKWLGNCQIPNTTMSGKRFEFKQSGISACIPNGWELGSNISGSGESLTAGKKGIVYKSGESPMIVAVGGTDGATPFAMYLNSPPTKVVPGNGYYQLVGAFRINNVVGYHYKREQKVNGGSFADVLAKGSVAHAYYFENGKYSLQINYVIFPGDKDVTTMMERIINTLEIE